jgi:sugar lactone lactonase YvrE
LAFEEDDMNPTRLIRLLAAACLIATPVAAQTPQVTTMASYPHGAFLENLSVDGRGRLLITSYLDKTLLAWNGRGAPMPLVTLDVHPVGVLARPRDIIVSAHGKSFADGPAFTATNQLLVLDRGGAVKTRVAVPDALFLNGMVALDANTILVADSLAGKIWRFNPATGVVDLWLADPLLATDPANPSQRPGANGLKVHNGALYVSNSARGAIYRVPLSGTLPAGPLTLFAATGPVDDFTFLSDGSIAAATHGARLIRVAPDGRIIDIMPSGCDACTSVTTYGRRHDLIVLTTGNLLEGGDAPARILRVASPVH